MSKWQPFKV